MNTPFHSPLPGDPLPDLEEHLRSLSLRDVGEPLAAQLESDLLAAYTQHKRRHAALIRLAWAACATLAAGSLALLDYGPSGDGSHPIETASSLVTARPTGHDDQGTTYAATFERRVSVHVTPRCRIVVVVPEERTLLLPDETI